jgi:hypothetical protein
MVASLKKQLALPQSLQRILQILGTRGCSALFNPGKAAHDGFSEHVEKTAQIWLPRAGGVRGAFFQSVL